MLGRRLAFGLHFSLPPLIATLFALVSGFIVSSGTDYGFPLLWRTQIRLCQEIFSGRCYIQVAYDWPGLLFDIAFYTAFTFVLVEIRKELQNSAMATYHFMMHLPRSWSELARPFQVSSVMGLIGGSYLTRLTIPLLIVEWAPFSKHAWNGQLSGIGSLILVAIALVAIFAIPIGGAVTLISLRLNDGHRGILALFVTIFSAIPVLFLSIQILYWILPFWQYTILALVWAVLLLMAAQILYSMKPSQSNIR